jgi:transposase
MLLVESVQTVCRLDEGFRKQYKHRRHRMKKGIAKLAAARKLALRLYWMLRTNTAYPEILTSRVARGNVWLAKARRGN